MYEDEKLLEDNMSPDYRRPINSAGDAAALLPGGGGNADPVQLLKEHHAKTAQLVAAVKKANPMSWRNVFDPVSNFGALFEQSPARTLGGLDSLKTLSMFQIILVHSGLLTLLIGRQINLLVFTENLLENTDGRWGRSTLSMFSRGVSLLPSSHADARCIDDAIAF